MNWNVRYVPVVQICPQTDGYDDVAVKTFAVPVAIVIFKAGNAAVAIPSAGAFVEDVAAVKSHAATLVCPKTAPAAPSQYTPPSVMMRSLASPFKMDDVVAEIDVGAITVSAIFAVWKVAPVADVPTATSCSVGSDGDESFQKVYPRATPAIRATTPMIPNHVELLILRCS